MTLRVATNMEIARAGFALATRFAALVILIPMSGERASAQALRCMDERTPTESLEVAFTIVVSREAEPGGIGGRITRAEREGYLAVARAIAAAAGPPPIELPRIGHRSMCAVQIPRGLRARSGNSVHAFNAAVTFVVGQLEEARAAEIVRRSDATFSDSALLVAVGRDTVLRTLRRIPRLIDLPLRVSIDVANPKDARAVVWFSRKVPVLDARGVRVRGRQPLPKYPEQLRQMGYEGDVLMEYIVDSAGHADPTSLVVSRVTDVAFSREVLAVIGRWSFDPARINGCPVPQLVRQPFQFRMATPPNRP